MHRTALAYDMPLEAIELAAGLAGARRAADSHDLRCVTGRTAMDCLVTVVVARPDQYTSSLHQTGAGPYGLDPVHLAIVDPKTRKKWRNQRLLLEWEVTLAQA